MNEPNHAEVVAEVFSAIHAYAAALVQPYFADHARHNRRNSWRIFAGIFLWKYALLPLGCSQDRIVYLQGDYALIVYAREVFIFGFRVARWVTGYEKAVLIKNSEGQWQVQPSARTPLDMALAGNP